VSCIYVSNPGDLRQQGSTYCNYIKNIDIFDFANGTSPKRISEVSNLRHFIAGSVRIQPNFPNPLKYNVYLKRLPSVRDLMVPLGCDCGAPSPPPATKISEAERKIDMQNQLLMHKVPLDSLKDPAAPLRRHSAAKQRKLKKSLDHYGMLVPLLVAKGK
jgi:hypothetical protein